MIAAGVNAKALSAFMGHASVTITLDRYGHLFPGSESDAADLLDAYLDGARKPRPDDLDAKGALHVRCTGVQRRGVEKPRGSPKPADRPNAERNHLQTARFGS